MMGQEDAELTLPTGAAKLQLFTGKLSMKVT